jgi:hypothetical protein
VKSPLALDVTPEKGPSSKMTLLRKQMEENRLEKLLLINLYNIELTAILI